MDYSRRVDELQQRVAAIKAGDVELIRQLRRARGLVGAVDRANDHYDLAGIVITSGQDGRYRTVGASTSSQ